MNENQIKKNITIESDHGKIDVLVSEKFKRA